jgi:hypothetical protein
MPRPSKAYKKVQEAQGRVDAIIAGVPNDVMLAGLLGATAALGGVTPPLTLLLSTFNKELTSSSSTWHMISTPGWKLIMEALSGTPNAHGMDPDVYAKALGMAASGAMEGMLMMTLMKNPAFIAALGNVTTEAIKTAQSAAAGLLG